MSEIVITPEEAAALVSLIDECLEYEALADSEDYEEFSSCIKKLRRISECE